MSRTEYRAQVRGARQQWVDGGLFTRKRDALRDAARLEREYGQPSRVLVFYADGGFDVLPEGDGFAFAPQPLLESGLCDQALDDLRGDLGGQQEGGSQDDG